MSKTTRAWREAERKVKMSKRGILHPVQRKKLVPLRTLLKRIGNFLLTLVGARYGKK